MSGGTGDAANLPTDSQIRYGPFFGFDICSSEAACSVVLAVGGTASNLHAKSSSAPGTGTPDKSWTFTVFKNGVAQTALQCAISGTSTACNDTTGTVTFAAGDTISIQIVGAENPPGNVMGSWSIQYS